MSRSRLTRDESITGRHLRAAKLKKYSHTYFASGGTSYLASNGYGDPSGTEDAANLYDQPDVIGGGLPIAYYPIGTQTILGPVYSVAASGGLDVSQDQTENDGVQHVFGGQTADARGKHVITVGTDADYFAKLKFRIANVSGLDDVAFGFRKVEAIQAVLDAYDEAAFFNVISGDIYIQTILNGAATASVDTTDNWTDTEEHTLELQVKQNGEVKFLLDDAEPTVSKHGFAFDAGEVIVPFFYMLNDTAPVGGYVRWTEFEAGYIPKRGE